jgi:phage shock protein A
MNDLVTLVSGIEFKARNLINKIEQLENEVRKLEEENDELKLIIKDNKLKINQLENKNQIIELSKVLEGKEGSTKAKLRINELLREVDRCIGLLND